MVVTKIGEVDVDFPYEPYGCQVDYMTQVIKALQMQCDAALESPTGTGKTLSLLCSTLGWLQSKKMTFAPSLKEAMAMANADKHTPLNIFPKIYYCSRTHSQLAQVVRELNKTVYKIVPTAVIGSRDQLCIHEKVQKEKENRIKSMMCHSMVSKRTCHYYNKWDACKTEDLNSIYSQDGNVPDIEDIVTAAKKHSHCPYFRTRQMQESAELILLPYNYLISPELRKLHKIDLKGNIVIFDEAHNLEAICEECVSVEVSTTDVAMCIRELKKAIELMQEDLELVRSQMDSSVEQFGKNKEATKKDEPPFEVGEAATVLGMFFDLEKVIDEAYKDSEKSGKNYHDFPGKVFPGEAMLNILGKAHFNFDKASDIVRILHGASVFLHEKAEILGAMAVDSKGYLNKMEGFLSVVFASHPGFCGAQNVNLRQVGYDHLKPETMAKDFKLYMVKENENGEESSKITLNYWCFTAGLAMQSLKQRGVRSVIVTSGTLSPLPNFISNIGLDFGCTLENGHAASNSQVIAGIVKRGPGKGEILNGKFANRGNIDYLTGVGESLLHLARTVPQGILVFFASYGLMDKIIEVLKQRSATRKQSIWEQLQQLKTVVVEPRNRRELAAVRMEFTMAVRDVKGGLFMAVCRGKVSEGIDFADADSRAVCVVGIPYPPIADPRVKLKRIYLDEKRANNPKLQNSDTWYQMEGFRAVNQAIGRVLRHVNDFGVVALLDSRFATAPHTSFSSWLRPSIKVFEEFDGFHTRTNTFFRERGHDIQVSREKLLMVSNVIGKRPRKKPLEELAPSVPLYDLGNSLDDVEPVRCKENVRTEAAVDSLADLGEAQDSSSPPKRQEKVRLPASFGAVTIVTTEASQQPARKKIRLTTRPAKFKETESSSSSPAAPKAAPISTIPQTATKAAAKDLEIVAATQMHPQVTQILNLGNSEYLDMLKSGGLFNEVMSVLKAYKKGTAFDDVYPQFKRILLPKHPKLFLGLAKFLKPDERQRVISDGSSLL